MKVLVFKQDNCAPCRGFDPHIKAVAHKLDFEIEVIDVTNNWEKAKEWSVQSTPTAYVVDNNEVKHTIRARTTIPLLVELKTFFKER